jgi:type II secretory pathway component PulF
MNPNSNFLEIATVTRHLSVMLTSGIPINEALESLVEQTHGSLKKALVDVLQKVTQGSSLTKALASHPKIFNSYYISLVGIGEESGTLEENLIYLSNQLQKDIITRRKFTTALLYPSFVLSFAFIIGGGISIFILPKLVDFFTAFNIQLPITTQILLAIAVFMKNWGVLLFGGIFVFVVLFAISLGLKPVRDFWDKIIIHLPYIGSIVGGFQVTRLCRNFGTLIKSGVPVARALEVTSASLSNNEFSSALNNILIDVENGQTLTSSMEKYKIFPKLLTRMVGVGEKSGTLDESLLYLADFYDGELDDLTKNLETVLEPILLVVIGFIVAFIALAIITPIYQLTGSIGVTTP